MDTEDGHRMQTRRREPFALRHCVSHCDGGKIGQDDSFGQGRFANQENFGKCRILPNEIAATHGFAN